MPTLDSIAFPVTPALTPQLADKVTAVLQHPNHTPVRFPDEELHTLPVIVHTEISCKAF